MFDRASFPYLPTYLRCYLRQRAAFEAEKIRLYDLCSIHMCYLRSMHDAFHLYDATEGQEQSNHGQSPTALRFVRNKGSYCYDRSCAPCSCRYFCYIPTPIGLGRSLMRANAAPHQSVSHQLGHHQIIPWGESIPRSFRCNRTT